MYSNRESQVRDNEPRPAEAKYSLEGATLENEHMLHNVDPALLDDRLAYSDAGDINDDIELPDDHLLSYDFSLRDRGDEHTLPELSARPWDIKFEGSSRQIETTEDLENTRVSPHQPKIHEFFPRLAHPQPSFQPRPTAGPLSHGPTCIRTPVQSILYDFFPPHRVHDDETARDNCIDPAVSPSSSTMERGFSSEDDMGDALEVAGENNREKGHRKAEGRGKGHEREKPAKRVCRDFIPSLATTKSKGRVEYFIDQVLSNPFVSLEAEVDRDAEEDDDEDVTDEFETFLDDSEPVPGIQASSRSILLQEHERLYNETDWEELLDRARTRSRIRFSPDGPGAQSIPAIFNIPLLGSQPGQFPSMWRVRVKPGFKEPVTTVLMNKIMRAGVGCWAVSAVIGNYSRPGWIAVESKSHKDVVRLCSDVLNVYPKDVHSIDPSDAHLWLKMPAPYSPKPDTWVRLSKGRYKGDLAYVWDFDEEQWLATALVVPRLDYSGKPQKGKGKQKQKTRHSQGLFNQRLIKQLYGASSIERRNQVFLFQGRCFKDGYEELFTGDFLPEEAFPTVDELSAFELASCISAERMHHFRELAEAQRLKPGDYVVVADGQSKGCLGTVHSISGNEAVVDLEGETAQETVALRQLRKNVVVGDHVQIVAGPEAGKYGWVVSISGQSLEIYDQDGAKEITALGCNVDFMECPHTLGPLRRPTTDMAIRGPTEALVESTPYKDLNKRLIGRHVHIIKKHRLKDYKGIFKATLDNNIALVEIQPTMKNEHIPINMLGLIDGRELSLSDQTIIPVVPRNTSRLAYYKPSHILLPSVKNPLEMTESSSRYLLGDIRIHQAPSTPMPAPSRVALSPAWDPSSRTPNPNAAYPYNTWMNSPLLANKRIRVLFADTIPCEQHGGWKNGEMEGRTALWVGAKNGEALLQQADGKALNVPERYVRPLRPHARGTIVVVVAEGLITGQELYVIKYGKEKCSVRPGDEVATPYNRKDVDTDSLVVVAPGKKC